MTFSAHPKDLDKWKEPAVTEEILGREAAGQPDAATMLEYAKICAGRMRNLRRVLRAEWIGMSPHEMHELGHLLDWLLAGLIARENVLLLGWPGVAKTQVAIRTFQLLGLSQPEPDNALLDDSLETADRPYEWWQEREEIERKRQKYFYYLLTRYTQPDELFGPIEITLLRKGLLVRVNFGFLTGPGVRAAFLDEIFKGGSSILNTLLTLSQERRYFNWGGMRHSDLNIIIGASNEMPGGFATGTAGVGTREADFQLLYAFLDRFVLRLYLPMALGKTPVEKAPSDKPVAMHSQLAEAWRVSMNRERASFTFGDHFAGNEAGSLPMPCINDVLFLGRCCFQAPNVGGRLELFNAEALQRFDTAFLQTAADLQDKATNPRLGRITWTISPRKLNAVYKVALAHALVADDGFQATAARVNGPGPGDLYVFNLIWDSETSREPLRTLTMACVHEYCGRSS